MFSEIFALALAILGIVFILFSVVFRLAVWKLENFKVVIPLSCADKEIYNQIINMREALEFCSLNKKSTIVVVNYGAPDWFCDELRECFSYCDFLTIVNANEAIKALHT